jgi:formylglycine-generating enzyme required for sulfatase activity/serine/threonine protein kinase
MTESDPLSDLPTIGGSSSRLRAGNAVGPGGRYVLEKEAGRGGMGVVWRARDTQLDDRLVALKFLPEVLATDEIALQDLRREARTMLELTHPGIVRLHTLEADEGLLFLVMEWLEGPTLRSALAECRQTERGISAEDARWILKEIAAAIDHAHEKGVLHRDIKPANLMLTEPTTAPLGKDGAHVKLTDFGIAYVANTSFTQLTGQNHTSGTLPYMAPELITGGRPSQSSDLYALGATLYELIAGEAPFCRGDISLQIRKQEPVSLDSGDAALDAAIAAALAKDPADRPASATAFLRVAQGKRLRRTSRPSSELRTRASRGRWLMGVIGAALLAAISYFGWSMFGGPGDEGEAATPSAEIENVDPTEDNVESDTSDLAEVALPKVELTEPADGSVTSQDYLTVKGGLTNASPEGIQVQFLGFAETRLKPQVQKEGIFKTVISLPKEDGRYFLQVLSADDETEIHRCELWVDRTPPSLIGEPKLSVEGPFRLGDELLVSLEFNEAVALRDKFGKDLSTVLDLRHRVSLIAPETNQPNPTPVSVTLLMLDEAGNQEEFDVAIPVYDQQNHEQLIASQRPDSLDEWYGLNQEGRFQRMANWVSEVENDKLLRPEIREEILRARPPVFREPPKVLDTGPFRSGSNIRLSLSLDQTVTILMDGEELGQLEGNSGEVEIVAPKANGGDPEEESVTLQARDAEGDAAQVEVMVEVYDGVKRYSDLASARPETQDEWDPAQDDVAEASVLTWTKRVIGDSLLTEDERKALLEMSTAAAQIREAREVAAERLNPFYAERWTIEDSTPGHGGHAKKLKDPKTGIIFILVEPGKFTMGSPNGEKDRDTDETEHTVTLTEPFYLGETEVTQAQWEKLMKSNPSEFQGDDLPVETVSWKDCQEYLKKAGAGYRLPTEAEWEYACRAKTTTPFSFGETISTSQANVNGVYTYGNGSKGVYRGKTTPAGSLGKNAWGFYDMHGNVNEWCEDWYSEGYYENSPAEDPKGPSSGETRVLRGGGWDYFPRNCRSALRGRYGPDYRLNDNGFRVARALP